MTRPKFARLILRTLAVLFLAPVVLLALVALYTRVNGWNWMRSPLAEVCGRLTKASCVITGDLDVRLTSHPRLRVGAWTFRGFETERVGLAAGARYVEATARWRKDWGRVEIDRLVVEAPTVEVVKRSMTKEESTAADRAGEGRAFDIDAFVPTDARISDGRLVVVPAPPEPTLGAPETKSEPFRLELAEARLRHTAQSVALGAKGVAAGHAFDVDLTGAPLDPLLRGDPWSVKGEASAGETFVVLDGKLTDGFYPDLELDLRGQDLSDALDLAGLEYARTPPYRIAARLRATPESRWTFEVHEATTGRTDLRGTVGLDFGVDPLAIKVELASSRVVPADLAPFFNLKPGAPAKAPANAGKDAPRASGPLLSDEPFEPLDLRAVALDLALDVEKVESVGPLPIGPLHLDFELGGGKAVVKALSVGYAGGKLDLTGELFGETSGEGSKARQLLVLSGRLAAVGLDPDQLLAATAIGKVVEAVNDKDVPLATGRVAGRATLATKGDSVRSLVEHADASVDLVMGGGRVSDLLLEAFSLDLVEALGVLAADDKGSKLSCVVASFESDEGILESRAILLATADHDITGAGSIDLLRERIDITLKSHVQDASLGAANTDWTITGDLRSPTVRPKAGPLVARAAAAAALGAVIAPLAALIPFIETGTGENQPCGPQVARIRKLAESASSETTH